jgi:hypothetical protein
MVSWAEERLAIVLGWRSILLATPSSSATARLSRIRHAVLDDVRELEAG